MLVSTVSIPVVRRLALFLSFGVLLAGAAVSDVVNAYAVPYELSLPSSITLSPGTTLNISARFTNLSKKTTLDFVVVDCQIAVYSTCSFSGSGLTVFSTASFFPGLPVGGPGAIGNFVSDPPTGANVEFFGRSLAPGQSIDFIHAQMVAFPAVPSGFVTFMNLGLAISPDFHLTEHHQNFFSPTVRIPFSIADTITVGRTVSVKGDTTLSSVPEPATLLLVGTGAAGLGLARWVKRRRSRDHEHAA
jgi:hypothetical protein